MQRQPGGGGGPTAAGRGGGGVWPWGRRGPGGGGGDVEVANHYGRGAQADLALSLPG